jgi:hypothetical protein
MDLPLKLPDHLEEARKRAQEFQRLSPDEKWQKIAELFANGWAIVKASPHRAAIERRIEEDEKEWRRIQKELFSRYAAQSEIESARQPDQPAARVDEPFIAYAVSE